MRGQKAGPGGCAEPDKRLSAEACKKERQIAHYGIGFAACSMYGGGERGRFKNRAVYRVHSTWYLVVDR